MVKAKDVMTTNLITVTENTPIYEAVELFVKHGISGMPVVNDDMTLVGVLSEKDAIKVIHELKEAEDKTVSDFMTQPHIGFDLDESLLDVCEFLEKNIFRRVPITAEEKLVGIISIRDTLKYVLQLRQARADAD
jgi:CBS domain-containing protein